MLYKAPSSAVQCCGGRGTEKGRDVLCVSADLSKCPSNAVSPVIRAGAGPGPGGGVSLVFGGKHGRISV